MIKYYEFKPAKDITFILIQNEGITLFYTYSEKDKGYVQFVTDYDTEDPSLIRQVSKAEAFKIAYNEYTYMKGKSFIQKACFLASFFHFGQKWKDGKDMMHHIYAVANSMVEVPDQIVAILHEVLQRTDCNAELLKAVFGERISEACVAITRKRGEDIMYSYIPRVRKNELARKVKIADIRETMDLNKLPEVKEEDLIIYHRLKQEAIQLGATFAEVVPSSVLLEETRFDSKMKVLPKLRTKSYNKLTDLDKAMLPDNPYKKSKAYAYFEFEGKEGYWVTDSAKKECHETIEMKPIKL